MELLLKEKIIIINRKQYQIETLAEQLSTKSARAIADVFESRGEQLPRELRMKALRTVLNHYVMIAKEMPYADELYHRLTYYPEYSEFQLENFYRQVLDTHAQSVNDKALILEYKKNFFLLLIYSAPQLKLTDDLFSSLQTAPNGKDNFDDFEEALKPCFYDYVNEFDGLSYDDFRRVLGASATLNELRELGVKYGMDIPRRLKKDELVEIIAHGLKKQGKYDEAVKTKISNMSILPLQRFAKDHGIKASTELKKDEVIEYIIDKVDDTVTVVQKLKKIELTEVQELEDFEFKLEYLRDMIEKPVLGPVTQANAGLTPEEIEKLISSKLASMMGAMPSDEEIEQRYFDPILEETTPNKNSTIISKKEESLVPEVVEQDMVRTIIEHRDTPRQISEYEERLLKALEETNSRISYLERQLHKPAVGIAPTQSPVNIIIKYGDGVEVRQDDHVIADLKEQPRTIIAGKNEQLKTDQVIPVNQHQSRHFNETLKQEESRISPKVERIDVVQDHLTEFEKMKVVAKQQHNLKTDEVEKQEEYATGEEALKQRDKVEKIIIENDDKKKKKKHRRRFFRVILWTILFLLLLFIVYAVFAIGVYRADQGATNGLVFHSNTPMNQFFNHWLHVKLKFMEGFYQVVTGWYQNIENAILRLLHKN